ncbi:UNVERIFIED_CONTAM: DUF3939 domain-containing protein [Halobacillus marinus]
MWNRKKKQTGGKEPEQKDLSIHDIRKAVHSYADAKPKEVTLSVLIQDDLTLDYELLFPYLHAVPKDTFYMSRETYQLFEEQDKDLAHDIDMVQHALDLYMKQTQELPIIDGDPYKRISYYKLERLGLLPYRPERDFYLTKEEYMITYQKPGG